MQALQNYVDLLDSFVNSNISVEEFQQKYFKLFKNEKYIFPEIIFLHLDKLFADIDAFCADINLRDPSDLDEDQLRTKVLITLSHLRQHL